VYEANSRVALTASWRQLMKAEPTIEEKALNRRVAAENAQDRSESIARATIERFADDFPDAETLELAHRDKWCISLILRNTPSFTPE
jgi:hypothetical protein